jgi:glycyl-tRNA synthetase beta subunit
MKAAQQPPQHTTGDFLFEIGCEEIPAGMIFKASQELKVILEKHLATIVWSTSRQLTLRLKLSARPAASPRSRAA